MRNGPYELVIAPADYPGMRYRGRYVYEHILVWWQNTGEVPGEGEVVHHKDENKRHNVFSNLEKKTRPGHSAEHGQERAPAPVDLTCDWCGNPFTVKPANHRQRVKQSLSGRLFCSRSCQVHQQQEDLSI